MNKASHPLNKASLEIWFIFPLNYFEDAFIDSVSLDAFQVKYTGTIFNEFEVLQVGLYPCILVYLRNPD